MKTDQSISNEEWLNQRLANARILNSALEQENARLIAERNAARLVARKRLELLIAEGIIGGECEGCLMEHPLVGEYHEHGPSGIRIKCSAAQEPK